MSVIKNLFDRSKVYASSVKEDLQRVVNYDSDGVEYVTYEPVDYKKIIDSHGSVSDWSLDTLLKAGIDPAFPIHTGLSTRLDGVSVINELSAQADSILSSETPKAE